MESPRKNNDCYFYYYSTCTKGDSCTFRHEPSALGCETTCSFWKEGKCINVRCNFRHMELRKNRKVIPCYWESQPGGCLKPHCPFLHQNPKHPSNSENQGEPSDIKSQDLNKAAIQNTDSCAKNASQGSEKNFGNPVVDPLVVNFEEESDNESAPTHSPAKTSRSVNVKTLEEIRLEKIQAESAAYYSYPEIDINSIENADDLRRRIIKRLNMKEPEDEDMDAKSDFQVLSLDEIRNRKKRFLETKYSDEENPIKRQKISLAKSKRDDANLVDLKVKTLDEIRAERAKKFGDQSVTSSNEINVKQNDDTYQSSGDSEVSSTSRELAMNVEDKQQQTIAKVQPVKRLKRKISVSESHDKDVKVTKVDLVNKGDDGVELNNLDEVFKGSNVSKNEVDGGDVNGGSISIGLNLSAGDDVFGKRNVDESSPEKLSIDSSKLDDVLLLDVEEFESNDVLKAEEDILKDIDKFLND